jgi:hypothetical protein
VKSDEVFKDLNSVQAFFDKVFDSQTDATRVMNERIVWRNLLYYCGEQYIEYLKSSGSFRRRQTPDYIPTPVSNEIREFVRSTKALLLNQKMVPRVWPNTNEKEDQLAGEAGENLLVWMDQSNDGQFFDELEKTCIWLCLSGTAFLRVYPNLDGGKMVTDGEAMWKTGDVGVSSIIPFNIRLDSLGDIMEKKRWVGILSLEDPEWVEDTFQVKLKRNGDDKNFLDYQKRLTKLVSDVSPWKGHSLDFQILDAEDDDSVLFRELEFRPTFSHPAGQYFVSCGGQVIYQRDRLPIKSTPEEWNYSLTAFHYNFVPGRFWSDAAVNDLISPQNTINEIDQALAINRKGMARPLVFLPGDVGLKKVEMAGRGFNLLSYNPIMGQKPQVENGTPLPQQVLEERQLQKQQMQDSGGDPKNVLRGSAPSAQSSGVQLDMLRETVTQGKTPDIDRFNRSKTKVYKKRLLLGQEIFTEERILKIAGKGNKHKIIKFKASDLRGNTDVRLELDSGLLATKSGQTQVLMSMLQFGAFGDLTENPTMREELFKRFGMSSFEDKQNLDQDRAETENMGIASGERAVQLAEVNPETQQPEILIEDPLFKYDDHVIHYEEHKAFALSAEFKDLPEEYQVIHFGHMDTHRAEIDGAKPDMRQFVQIDKLFPMLTRVEQMQVLQDVGITPDPTGEVTGLPDSSKIAQANQHLQDTAVREGNKAKQIANDKMKIMFDAMAKSDTNDIAMEAMKKSTAQAKTGGAGK